MKAIRIHRHGGPEVLSVDELPRPTPGAREILVKTAFTALNHMDIWVRNGIPGIGALPLTLGCDLSGNVAEVGSEVGDFMCGESVLLIPLFTCGTCEACHAGRENLCRALKIPGEHVNGTHAEYFCAPAESFLKIPAGVGMEDSAGFPLAAMTAWHMVVTNGCIKAGMEVLVMAAASGVGSMAVKIAKHFGARVLATAGGKQKMEEARALGAFAVIDHYAEKISARVKALTDSKGADLIIEHVGEKVWDECLKSLAWGGRLVTCGATTGPKVHLDLRHLFIKQQQIIGSTMGTRRELESALALLGQGFLRPKIAVVYDYPRVREAHEFLESSKNFGKVLLRWD